MKMLNYDIDFILISPDSFTGQSFPSMILYIIRKYV